MCEPHFMNEILIERSPCKDNFKQISPGMVSSVGDVLMAPRFRTSNAAMFPVMFDARFTTDEGRLGSYLADGYGPNLPATAMVSKWNIKQSTKTDVGNRWQDIRQGDNLVEPIVVGQNRYDFKNASAAVQRATTTGDKFLPLPGEYTQEVGLLPRGGLVPQRSSIGGGPTPKYGDNLEGVVRTPNTAPIAAPDQGPGCKYNPSKNQFEGNACIYACKKPTPGQSFGIGIRGVINPSPIQGCHFMPDHPVLERMPGGKGFFKDGFDPRTDYRSAPGLPQPPYPLPGPSDGGNGDVSLYGRQSCGAGSKCSMATLQNMKRRRTK